MRAILLTTGAVSVALLAGCVNADGAFVYDLHGRLTDAQSNPLPNRRVAVRLRPFELTTTQPAGRTAMTAADGQFSQSVSTGIAWGYAKLFGFIPLGNTHPERPPLGEVFVAAQDSGGGWQSVAVPVPNQPEAHKSPVELGDVHAQP